MIDFLMPIRQLRKQQINVVIKLVFVLLMVTLKLPLFAQKSSISARYKFDKDASNSILDLPWIWVGIAAIVIILVVAIGRIINTR